MPRRRRQKHKHPLDRDGWVFVYGQDPKKWAKRFGIEPVTTPCYKCGAEATTSIAFFSGDLRGLMAPWCSCGHPTPPYCVVSVNGDILEKLLDEHLKDPT